MNSPPPAPGARVAIRDEEWIVRSVTRANLGGHAVRASGVSGLVRGHDAIFLTALDRITELAPETTDLVADPSPQYQDFLVQRRERIAQFIAAAHEKLLDKETKAAPMPVDALIRIGEGEHVELKSTLRTNLHTGQKDPRMELAVLRTIAGFLNTRGGSLMVGVGDDGETVGLAADDFASEDKMNLHLVNLVRDRIGAQYLLYVHPRFEDRGEHRVLVVECWAASSAVFVKDGSAERFYVRTGASTTELSPSQTQDYIKRRFP